ncbi:hypothetical protein D9611_004796 [Ephemerocybe angulata]|uniref:2',3'-cyclic-nucleotide 3'-phosphodiesterase n=1 Tax=Ephemerocybe angulata TaxID=980116 RepID=A0A8H5EXG2_9AGAR|nr:hypothetical protein D9611_004796 [Tulosesus angulatus]
MVAIWILPSSSDREKLRTVMRPQHDTSTLSASSYPNFEPHITLASVPNNFSLSDIRAALQTSLPKGQAEPGNPNLLIKFASLVVGEHYFRSVYVAVEHSPELAALHEKFHASLGVQPRTPAFPHCSVAYVADEDAEKGERAKFERALREAGKVREGYEWGKRRVALLCAGEWVDGWEAAEVWLAECVGPVEGWKILDKIPL